MEQPVMILSVESVWSDAIAGAAASVGAELKRIAAADRYIDQLVDDHAALIVVDGAASDWQFWVAAPKVSPATRRIPVIIVSDDPSITGEAMASGADFVLSPAEIEQRLPGIFLEYGRMPDHESRAAMADQCRQPLPPEALHAIEMFNRGEYYRQHDLFEALWMQETGPVRDLYRAILQVGIAYFQVARGNRSAALKMVLRSIQWFHVLPDVCQGVDVAALHADALRLRDALTNWPDDRHFEEFDQSLLGQVHLADES